MYIIPAHTQNENFYTKHLKYTDETGKEYPLLASNYYNDDKNTLSKYLYISDNIPLTTNFLTALNKLFHLTEFETYKIDNIINTVESIYSIEDNFILIVDRTDEIRPITETEELTFYDYYSTIQVQQIYNKFPNNLLYAYYKSDNNYILFNGAVPLQYNYKVYMIPSDFVLLSPKLACLQFNNLNIFILSRIPLIGKNTIYDPNSFKFQQINFNNQSAENLLALYKYLDQFQLPISISDYCIFLTHDDYIIFVGNIPDNINYITWYDNKDECV